MAIPIYETKISRIEQETPNTKTLYIDVPEEFTFKPGQFIMVLLEIDGKEAKRAYSISTSPEEKGIIGLTVKLEPNSKGGSLKLHSMHEGDAIKIQGPYGMFVTEKDVSHAVLIAAGSGIAPFRAMWRYRVFHNLGPTDVMFTAPNIENLIFYDEMVQFEKEHDDFHVYFTLTREFPEDWSHGRERLTLEKMREESKDFDKSIFYLCGSPQFCEAMKQLLFENNIPKEQVKMEKYW